MLSDGYTCHTKYVIGFVMYGDRSPNMQTLEDGQDTNYV